MKSSKLHRHYFFLFFFCHMSSLTRALLGICILLLEIRESHSWSGVGLSWSVYVTLISSTVAAETTTIISPEVPEVDGIPQFHSPQLRLTVKRGDRVLLPCKIHNLGDNHVIWRHGTNVLAGTNVSTYADERIQLQSDLTLEIIGVTREDEGEYECILTGTFSRPGLIHSVIIHDAPTVSLTTPTNLVVLDGDSVEIGCIPHGNPLPRVTWSMRDGQIPLPKGMLNMHRITLEKVTRRNAGLYVCSADNGVGRPAIGAVYVRVLYPPEIEIPKRRVHGGVGYRTQLVCIVHADPPADVKWRTGEKVVELSERISTETEGMNEYSLVVAPVKDYDFNTYTCEANNSRGYDIRHIDFTGVPNPPIISRWETQILVRGKGNVGNGSRESSQTEKEISVTLFWAVECYSNLIDYKLLFRADQRNVINGRNEERTPPWTTLTIPADQSSASFIHTKTFTLRGLQSATIYEAAIKARNKYGESPLSEVCNFSTFPNSSSTRQEEFQQNMQKWKESLRPGGKENLELSKEEIAEFVSSQRGTGAHILQPAVWKAVFRLFVLSLFPLLHEYCICRV